MNLICLIVICALVTTIAARAQTTGRPPAQPRTNSDKVSFAEAGTISGRVTLPSGNPINERVKITLNTTGKPGAISYTDGKGEFSFRNLQEGLYSIEVSADSSLYEIVREDVRLIRAGRVFVSISVRERRSPKRNESGGALSAAEIDQRVPPEARKEFERANKLIGDDKIVEAIERLKRAITIYPEYLMARNNLGAQYMKLNRLEEAAEQFKAVVEINPKAHLSRLNLAIALVNLSKFAEAIDQFNLLGPFNNDRPAGHFYFGFALLKSEQFDKAAREFKKALELGGRDYLIAHYYLAHYYVQEGKREMAVEELRTFLKKAPESHHAAEVRRLLEQLEAVK